MEARHQILTALTIQLDNPHQPPQFNGAPLISRMSVITNNGQLVFQQAGHVMEPAIADDLSPEILAQINMQLARIGFQLTKVEAE